MEQFEGISAAGKAVTKFIWANEDALPAAVLFHTLTHTGPGESAVRLCNNFAESVYAADRAKVSPEGLQIAGAVASLFDLENYHGRLMGRAVGISRALRRDSGEKAPVRQPWPKPEADPAPNLAEFGPDSVPAADAPPGAGPA